LSVRRKAAWAVSGIVGAVALTAALASPALASSGPGPASVSPGPGEISVTATGYGATEVAANLAAEDAILDNYIGCQFFALQPEQLSSGTWESTASAYCQSQR
jgi:hypothetical protein